MAEIEPWTDGPLKLHLPMRFLECVIDPPELGELVDPPELVDQARTRLPHPTASSC